MSLAFLPSTRDAMGIYLRFHVFFGHLSMHVMFRLRPSFFPFSANQKKVLARARRKAVSLRVYNHCIEFARGTVHARRGQDIAHVPSRSNVLCGISRWTEKSVGVVFVTI
jgi:hypothetical protein